MQGGGYSSSAVQNSAQMMGSGHRSAWDSSMMQSPGGESMARSSPYGGMSRQPSTGMPGNQPQHGRYQASSARHVSGDMSATSAGMQSASMPNAWPPNVRQQSMSAALSSQGQPAMQAQRQLVQGGRSPYVPLKPRMANNTNAVQHDQIQREQALERKMIDIRRKSQVILNEFPALQEMERMQMRRQNGAEGDSEGMEEDGLAPAAPLYHSKELQTRIQLRFKQLELLKLQRQVRAKVLQSLVEPQIPIVINPESCQVDLMKHPEASLMPMPRQSGNQSHQSLGLRLYQFKMKSFLEALEQHTTNFYNFHAQRLRKQREIAQMADRMVKEKEKKIQQRKEKAEKDRLKALKEHDTEAYYNLLKEHKNDKILSVLNETDKYLRALGSAVKVQKKHLGAKPEPKKPGRPKKKGPDGEEEDDDHDMSEDEFQRTDIRNTNDVDVKALMQNKAKYYQLAHTESEEVTAQPDMLVGGQLRQYQMQGLKWLVSLYNNKLSGVLADEMGLGKTIQIVALIAYLMEVKCVRGPYLVVAPLSTIDNWVREFETWTPNVNKIIYNGDKNFRKKLQQEASKGIFNVLLTSYEYVMKDAGYLSRIQWEYIIVDEGHRMKNSASRLTTTLSIKFPSRYRILITGTPLQNNLNELWSLLNFLLPNIFKHDSNFEQWFNTGHIMGATGDTVDMDEEEKLLLIDRLHQVLRPFLLRRLKSDVESELKAKVEKVIKCEMSACQWRLYEGIRDRGKVSLQPATEGGGKPKGRVATNIMMELRKACNHPYLFWYHERPEVPGPEIFRSSGKFELLDRFLPKLRSVGHKVLVFCQMTKLMDIMGDFLSWAGHRYLRLDGSTDPQTRGELIEIFNAPESPFATFILSTRAGGLGLNLPAADTVIIFDSDWNPQMDMQAMDRAHRIGQTREVRVLRMTCVDTLEEDILARAINKKELGGAAIDAGMFNEKSTVEDRHEFLRKLIFKKTKEAQERTVLSSEAMNREVARDEVEFEAFQAMDAQFSLKRYHNNRTNNRLMENVEVPSWLQYQEEQVDPRAREKETRVEKASRKSRKRKTASYKEDNISHSSDLDSTTDEEASALAQSSGKRKGPGRPSARQAASPVSDDEVDTQKDALAEKGGAGPAAKAKPQPEEPTDHNKDYCEICGDGGELICCDFCDCAYHPHCLGCAAEDLPDEYKCPKCVGTLEQLLAEYNSKPRSTIYAGDFCNLCGDSSLPLLACKTCPRSFHSFCCGAEPGTKPGSHWNCPECNGTQADAFAWSRLVPPFRVRAESQGIFREHAKPAPVAQPEQETPVPKRGREREEPLDETPAPKPRGRPKKGEKRGQDAAGGDGAPPKKKRGRPPKAQPKPQNDEEEDGAADNEEEGKGKSRSRRSTETPTRGGEDGSDKEGETQEPGSDEEPLSRGRSNSKRRRRMMEDD